MRGGTFATRISLMLCRIYSAGFCGSRHWLFVRWALCQHTHTHQSLSFKWRPLPPLEDNGASFAASRGRGGVRRSIMVFKVRSLLLRAAKHCRSIKRAKALKRLYRLLVYLNFLSCLVRHQSLESLGGGGQSWGEDKQPQRSINKKNRKEKRISLFSFNSATKPPLLCSPYWPACLTMAFRGADLLHLSGQKMMKSLD